MKKLPALALIAALTGACGAPPATCRDARRVADLPAALDEASGIAASQRHPGVLWVHNDSEGTPLLYAIDHSARLLAEIALPDARRQSDWEDIAVGPCDAGSCIYIGDIGDNLHERHDRAIIRIAEPALDSAAPVVERFPIRFPDAPEDAEALFVTGDGTVWIITKGRRSPVTLFRYPPPLRTDTVTLEQVQLLSDGIAQMPDQVTGADARADGTVAVRTYGFLRLYRLAGDTLQPIGQPPGFDLTPLAEPQGEGVAFGPDGALFLVTETGPQREVPFMSRLTCTAD